MLTRVVPRLYAALGVGRLLRFRPVERLYVAAFFAYKRRVEDPFAALVARRPQLFKDGHILDVGANIGYTASIFSRAADRGFTVFAFEPERVNAARMRRVLTRRHIENVVVVETAVSDATGEADLLINPVHPGDHKLVAGSKREQRTVRVPVTTIDDFVERHAADPVAFVKIDVQGAEMNVSRGMEKLLARTPRIAVAFEYSSDTSADILRFFTERGFTLEQLHHNGDAVPVSERTLAHALDRRGYVDILATRAG